MRDVFVIHPDGHTSAELIPGARDPSTLTHREAGSIGGDPYGADIPATKGTAQATRGEGLVDDAAALEPELEPPDPATEREREIIPPDRGGRRNE